MFSSSLRATLIALVASAVAVSAAPGLSVKVAGPEAVTGVDNLKVKTTITNTGDEILKILNEPHSPLSKLPAKTFKVTDANGAAPAFTGIKVKYSPAAAIAAGKDAITTLAPGQSVEVEHDLSEAYNFSKSGEGVYSVEANNLFYIVDPSNKAVPLYATTEAHHAKLTGKLAVVRAPQVKRATFNGCSSTQQSQLNTAASSAQSYASSAASYLSSHTSSTPRFTTWFGTYTSSRHTTALNHFNNINSHSISSYWFDCTCTDSGTYAYVYPDSFGEVYLCGAFWQAPNTGTDSKAGTLIHESSHFTVNGGTQDYVYGQSGAKQLAISNPDEAVMNADNHEYFAENNPAQS
ncbi:putative to MEROPS metallopeptidase family M35 [Lyophyllum shimeji]|uniref:To MEROPS metallopeptidase family M35 n=1 Tax=Lyophyllum shimeji TaxID=47721 RepID=A0A9P3PVF1_LYOSH|nr:putative to MEROPS metallopeptidase family M35 [Lyophyllum shimeji]